MQQPFTSKQLYMMNGGQKYFIGRDGFADVYDASLAEEQQWEKEVIALSLARIEKEENSSLLEMAISNLIYHNYNGLDALLLDSIIEASASRQIIFAAALWKSENFDSRYKIIFPILLQHKARCLNEVFEGINDLKNKLAARYLLVYCLEGDDDGLIEKAQRTLSIWAWHGLPALRENNLPDTLQYESKNLPAFQTAIERLKQILNITN